RRAAACSRGRRARRRCSGRARREDAPPGLLAPRRILSPAPPTPTALTPALLLDLDRCERNLAKMAAHVKAAGKKIRPHSKTHKCPEIARRQVAAGAVGVCVGKVSEAEVMAEAGVRNLLITTEVVGPEKIGRLLGVLRRQPATPGGEGDYAHA